MKHRVIAALLLSATVGLPATALAADTADRPASGGTAPGSRMGDNPPPASAGSPAGTRMGDGTGGTPSTQSSPSGSATFRTLDANKDGFISRDEARGNSNLSRQFDELDKDRDGRLSPAELSGGSSPRDASSRTGSPDRPSNPPAGTPDTQRSKE